MAQRPKRTDAAPAGMSAWRVVWWFGLVSLAADMVYEGARSSYGPLLAALGASGLVVGVVTGAGEAMALVLRLVFGPLADRSGSYWGLTIIGYGLTAVCVPLLASTPFVGAAGVALAATLILAERTGKAVRSPSKSALLAHVAAAVGRGKGFGTHKALDQVGAFAGPLLVASVIAACGTIWPGMLVLAVPGAVAMVLLVVLRSRVPDPSVYDPGRVDPRDGAGGGGSDVSGSSASGGVRGWMADAVGAGLPRRFFGYAVAVSITTGGLVTFGLIGYHLTTSGLLPAAVVPVAYAGAMLLEAIAALAVGSLFDRVGGKALYLVPFLVAGVPVLALHGPVWVALLGVGVWGLASGVQDSTVKALVAELVEPPRLATAYGVFAGIQGAFAVAGGALAGWLYDVSLTTLAVTVALLQGVAMALLVAILREPDAPPTVPQSDQ